MPLYAVTVQVFCETAEEAVLRTIVPGSAIDVEVQDLGNQVQFPPKIKVDESDDVLPLT